MRTHKRQSMDDGRWYIILQPLLPDRFVWRWSSTGAYSASSTYRAFFCGSSFLAGAKELWEMKAPPKIKLFFWLALHGRLWTLERRRWHGLQGDHVCALCSHARGGNNRPLAVGLRFLAGALDKDFSRFTLADAIADRRQSPMHSSNGGCLNTRSYLQMLEKGLNRWFSLLLGAFEANTINVYSKGIYPGSLSRFSRRSSKRETLGSRQDTARWPCCSQNRRCDTCRWCRKICIV